MTSRVVRAVSMLLALGSLALLLSVFIPSERRTKRLFGQLVLGMGRTEVQTTIGSAPGDYSSSSLSVEDRLNVIAAQRDVLEDAMKTAHLYYGGSYSEWIWDEGAILAVFDQHDQLVAKRYISSAARSWPNQLIGLGRRWSRRVVVEQDDVRAAGAGQGFLAVKP